MRHQGSGHRRDRAICAGAEVWVKVGDPAPIDPSELTFLATDTRTPYLAKYVGADANKVAHYPGAPGLRWVNTKGDKGPLERDGQRDDWGREESGGL